MPIYSLYDLRRHSATYASRNGVPILIILKVILSHQDLKTTQVYLVKVSDSETISWMDVLRVEHIFKEIRIDSKVCTKL